MGAAGSNASGEAAKANRANLNGAKRTKIGANRSAGANDRSSTAKNADTQNAAGLREKTGKIARL